MIVERLFVRPSQSADQEECESVRAIAATGIEGDRYFGRNDAPGQNLTLVEAEEIEAFLAALGRPADLSITRRNLVTRGVRLNALVGREFSIGTVRLRGVELCEPCGSLAKAQAGPELDAAGVVRILAHRAGLRADILSSGEIVRGAPLHVGDTD